MSNSPKKKPPVMHFQEDLQKYMKKSAKKTTKKIQPKAKEKPKSPPKPELVPIYLQIDNQPLEIFVDPKNNLEQITSSLYKSHPRLQQIQIQILEKLILKQIMLQMSKKVKKQPLHVVFEDEPRVVDLTEKDIRLLRRIFDMIACTSDGVLFYEQRNCSKLVDHLPSYHFGVLQQTLLMMFHRKQPIRFQDFVYLACEQQKLPILRDLFEQ